MILNVDYDSKGQPFRFVDPTTAQQYQSIENYHQRREIANDLHNEFKFSQFEWDGQNEGALCRDYLALVHNRDLHQLTSHMSAEIHKLLYERASRSQYLIKREENEEAYDDDDKEGTTTQQKEFIGFDETGQFGDILETMPTDWIAVDMWSQLVKFDIDTHAKNGLVLGLFVLNRPPGPAEEELIYDT